MPSFFFYFYLHTRLYITFNIISLTLVASVALSPSCQDVKEHLRVITITSKGRTHHITSPIVIKLGKHYKKRNHSQSCFVGEQDKDQVPCDSFLPPLAKLNQSKILCQHHVNIPDQKAYFFG